MTALLPVTLDTVNTRQELILIGSKARGLSKPGKELMPVKIEMLRGLAPWEAQIVMEACELLFAAILQFVDSELKEQRAADAIAVVQARLERGQADGTIRALLHGPTRHALLVAAKLAPIAFHAIMQISPELQVKDRLEGVAGMHKPLLITRKTKVKRRKR